MTGPMAVEANLLWEVFRDHRLVDQLIGAAGGWRTLSSDELSRLDLTDIERRSVSALQELVQRGYPSLSRHVLTTPTEVGEVCCRRLGGAVNEVLIALALDGQHRLLEEITVATGGSHALTLSVSDVLRPLIRAGARGYIVVHNHPSGDPTPSDDDIRFTSRLAAASTVVGITLVDHVVVGTRGGGYVSMFAQGQIHAAA